VKKSSKLKAERPERRKAQGSKLRKAQSSKRRKAQSSRLKAESEEAALTSITIKTISTILTV
jgi:hypothetical protein